MNFVTELRNKKITAKILKEYQKITDKNQYKTGKGIKLTLFYMLKNNYNIYDPIEYRKADKIYIYNSLKQIASMRALTTEEVIREYEGQLNINDLLKLID